MTEVLKEMDLVIHGVPDGIHDIMPSYFYIVIAAAFLAVYFASLPGGFLSFWEKLIKYNFFVCFQALKMHAAEVICR